MNIQETGIRGYLKWLKHDQPAIYQIIAPHIVQQVPQAFSDFEQSRAMGSLMGTTSGGWHSGPDWSDRPSSEYRWWNPQVTANPYGNVPSGLGGDTSGGFGSDFFSFDTDSYNPSASATDVSSAANTGAAQSDVTSIIGGLVKAASQVYLAKQQVDLLGQVNQMQLQRAQLGIRPLEMDSLSLGVPQIQVGLNKQTMTGGGIALGIVAVLGILALMSQRGKGSPSQA